MGKKKSRRKARPPEPAPEPSPSSRTKLFWPLAGLLAVAVVAVYALAERPAPQEESQVTSSTSTAPANRASRGERIPPYHSDPDDARPFPEIVSPMRFPIPMVGRAYQIAAEIPEVLAQQPCYCYCDSLGHGSLLDCWASDHGGG